jgi:Tol biopolymer transport system component
LDLPAIVAGMRIRLPRSAAPWLGCLAASFVVPAAVAGADTAPRNGQIAFAIRFDTEQLYSLRPEGSPVRRLTTDLEINYQAVESPDGKRIAFSRGAEGRSDIFVMNRDGSGLVNLTHTPRDDYDPMWSPDGRRLAFTSHRTGDDETYVMNADGSQVRRVTRSRGDDENPSWLPGGGRLVISSERAGKLAQIFVVRIADGRAVRLTHEKLYDSWAQASPNGRWIAYSAQPRLNTQGDLIVMRADGTHRRRITHGYHDDTYPAWAPDSRRLVYSRGDTLWLIDRDGRHNRSLVEGGDPSWARDGTIFFDNSTPENDEIGVIDPEGGPLRLLTEAANDRDVEPYWSSDGTDLLFQSDHTDDNEIWTMRADGTGLQDLSQAPEASDREPAWSPDKTKIAFSSNRGLAHNDYEIIVMNADGSEQVDLSRAPANDYSPAWSPDGRRLAFSRFGGQTGDIWVMDADGGHQSRLTTNAATDDEPSWSPDGSRILFMSRRSGTAQIYVMNADGSGQRLLVPGDSDSEPSWSPDGTKIVFDRLTGESRQIVVANADGSNTRVVGLACVGRSCGDAYAPDPSWQPIR